MEKNTIKKYFNKKEDYFSTLKVNIALPTISQPDPFIDELHLENREVLFAGKPREKLENRKWAIQLNDVLAKMTDIPLWVPPSLMCSGDGGARPVHLLYFDRYLPMKEADSIREQFRDANVWELFYGTWVQDTLSYVKHNIQTGLFVHKKDYPYLVSITDTVKIEPHQFTFITPKNKKMVYQDLTKLLDNHYDPTRILRVSYPDTLYFEDYLRFLLSFRRFIYEKRNRIIQKMNKNYEQLNEVEKDSINQLVFMNWLEVPLTRIIDD